VPLADRHGANPGNRNRGSSADLRGKVAGQAGVDWVDALGREVERLMGSGDSGIMNQLVRDFEKTLISKALTRTGGRRIEAANMLGMGRNTITRKIAELGIDDKGESENDVSPSHEK